MLLDDIFCKTVALMFKPIDLLRAFSHNWLRSADSLYPSMKQPLSFWIPVLSCCFFSVIVAQIPSPDPLPEEKGVEALPYLRGGDLSALTVYEQAGAVYRNSDGVAGDAIQILSEAGMNCFRLRVFVAPNGEGVVTNDLAYTLHLARRVKASGARLLIDLHYSDTWADPGKQYKPVAWEGLEFEALVLQVQRYTRETFEAFREAGITVDLVQLGNEITNGFLWPDGKLQQVQEDSGEAENWERFAALMLAAHKGLEQAYAGEVLPLRIHHIECTGEPERMQWYLDRLQTWEIPFDLIGLSYYPEWHGDLCGLRRSLNQAIALTHKPVMVVETAYDWHAQESTAVSASELRDLSLYPWEFTPEGQLAYLRELDLLVRSLGNHMGKGVLYWHPESRRFEAPFFIWKWGSAALFDHEGVLLPGARFGNEGIASSETEE